LLLFGIPVVGLATLLFEETGFDLESTRLDPFRRILRLMTDLHRSRIIG